jgi:hypothetical protein
MSAFGHGSFKQKIYDELKYIVDNDKEYTDIDTVDTISEVYEAVNYFCKDYLNRSEFIDGIKNDIREEVKREFLQKLK